MVLQPPGLGQHLAAKIEQLISSRGVRAGTGSPPWKNGGCRPATAAPPSATTVADGIAVRDALDGLIALSGGSPRSRQSRGRWCYAIPRRATDAGRQLGSDRVLTKKTVLTPAARMVLS